MNIKERARVVLVNRIFTSLYGMTLGEWLRLVRRHGWHIDAPYWPRAAFMTAMGALNSTLAAYEQRVYGEQIRSVAVAPPLFILGHWRSGTTHLHNLLALDEQWAYANAFQVFNPHTFLTTERWRKLLFVAPTTRMMDNMPFGAAVPFEDEFAVCGTLCSPFLGWMFPRDADRYDRYLTFRDVPAEEIAAWQAALLGFYQKLTYKYRRPLVLKSPPHTARIPLLLDLFPDAKFVHICRDPYTVFRSTVRQSATSLRTMGLQRIDQATVEDRIIRRYQTMYDAFFQDRDLIPAAQFHELRFEDLEQDPVGQVRLIYQQLNMTGFEQVQPMLEHYVAATATYRKNRYADLPTPVRHKLAHAWRRSFEAWDYAP